MPMIRLLSLAALACLAAPGCPDKKDSAGPASRPASAPAPAQTAPASAPAAEGLANALAAGDVQAALGGLDPRMEKAYRDLFARDKAAMARIGALLSTRKLVIERGRLAEYEVTEDGRTYHVVFELVNGTWRLTRL